ncbi:glycosyltransferase 1 domain-containing protein 1-like [Saccoglossus kowalevskii]|uniref:Glycosyltransferase 1 domain-containing protein 1-like n=1 Tax=Saccoglossus kowalevskii TaxID=10224 RepID=A0ABM0M180_SACKO|nr:PREDICTED: glycosyltransferase 1 domain-containing protein 1-like [Saccoglossus kowalevskii]
MHAAIRDSFALVNSSLSKGMSAAILEAMDLGVPVIVRDIPGNASICKHNETGLLYNTPDDFVMQSKRLLGCKTLQRSLTKNAKVYIRQEHGVLKEKENYTKLINSLLL